MDFPITIVLGDVGSGKSLYATYLAYMFAKKEEERKLHKFEERKKVFANFTLNGIPYVKYEIDDLQKNPFPDHLKNGLLLIDEIQEGGDAYEFMSSGTRQISKFISQIRKVDLEPVMISQRLNFIAKRIRELANYLVFIEKQVIDGIVKVEVFKVNHFDYVKISSKRYDLRPLFNNYNTKEIIQKKVKDKVQEDSIEDLF